MAIVFNNCTAVACGTGVHVSGQVEMEVNGFTAIDCDKAFNVEGTSVQGREDTAHDNSKPNSSLKSWLMQTASSVAAGCITG